MNKFCKYEIVTGWYTSGRWCEGSTEYGTIEAVIRAVKRRKEKGNLGQIVRICVACDYSNSINYKFRSDVVNELERELMEKLRCEI